MQCALHAGTDVELGCPCHRAMNGCHEATDGELLPEDKTKNLCDEHDIPLGKIAHGQPTVGLAR